MIENTEVQVKTSQHLNQPLMEQGFRDDDQDTAGAFSQQLLVDNQAGFDCLAEANLVCQQHAWRKAPGDFMCDI